MLLLLRSSAAPTVLFQDTFTLTDGANWSTAWAAVVASGGTATATVQSGKGRIATPSGATYAGGRKDVVGLSASDTDITGTVTANSAGVEQYAVVSIGSDYTGAGWAAGNSFALYLSYNATAASSTISIRTVVNFAETSNASVGKTLTGGVTYGFRLRRLGTTLTARVWATSGAEPGTWDLTWTIPGTLFTGGASVAGGSGGIAAVRQFDYDNISITNPNASASTDYPTSGTATGAGTATAVATAATYAVGTASGAGTASGVSARNTYPTQAAAPATVAGQTWDGTATIVPAQPDQAGGTTAVSLTFAGFQYAVSGLNNSTTLLPNTVYFLVVWAKSTDGGTYQLRASVESAADGATADGLDNYPVVTIGPTWTRYVRAWRTGSDGKLNFLWYSFNDSASGHTFLTSFDGAYQQQALGAGTTSGTVGGGNNTTGTAPGSGTTSGAATAAFTSSGSTSGTGTTSGVSAAQFRTAGTVTGNGTLSGADTYGPVAAGAVAGTGTTSGTSVAATTVTGTVTGAGTTSGATVQAQTSAGTTSGAGSVSGAAALGAKVSATVTGAGSLAAVSKADTYSVGSTSGTGTTSGTSRSGVAVAGTVTGAGSTAQTATTAAFTTPGVVTGNGTLAATATIGNGSAGTVTGAGTLTSSTDAAFTAPGIAAGVGTLTAAASVELNTAGTATGAGTATADTTSVQDTDGSTAGDGTTSGTSTLTGIVTAAVIGSGATTGTVTAAYRTTGTATGAGSLGGVLGGGAVVTGISQGAGTISSTVTANTVPVATPSAGNGTLTAAVTYTGRTNGTVTGYGTTTGAAESAPATSVDGAGSLSATTTYSGTVAGTVVGHGTLNGTTTRDIFRDINVRVTGIAHNPLTATGSTGHHRISATLGRGLLITTKMNSIPTPRNSGRDLTAKARIDDASPA